MGLYFQFRHATRAFAWVAIVLILSLTNTVKAEAFSVAGLEAIMNQYRASAGQNNLINDSRLNAAANNKAQDMLAHDYWAHVSPSGITPWYWISQAGYPFTYAGENLANGYTSDSAIASAWMGSPSHRANIMNSEFRNVGCGSATGTFQGTMNTIVVCMYGTSSQQSIAQAPAAKTSVATPKLQAVGHYITNATPVPTAVAIPTPVPTPVPTPINLGLLASAGKVSRSSEISVTPYSAQKQLVAGWKSGSTTESDTASPSILEIAISTLTAIGRTILNLILNSLAPVGLIVETYHALT